MLRWTACICSIKLLLRKLADQLTHEVKRHIVVCLTREHVLKIEKTLNFFAKRRELPVQCYLFAVERFHFSVGGLKVWGGDLCCALSNCRCLWEHTYFACLSLSFLIYRMRQKLLHGYKFMIILPALIAQFVVHRVHLIG